MLAARDEMLTIDPPPVATMGGDDELRQHERRRHVEAQRGLERLLARGEQWSGQPTARVVDEHVDAAELFDRTGHECLELRGNRDVGRHGERAPSELAHVGRDLLDVGFGARRAHDIGTGFGQCPRAARADALARAGDDRDATVEAELVEDQFASAFSIAPTMSAFSGSTSGEKRATTEPSRPTTNFSKFQRMSPV